MKCKRCGAVLKKDGDLCKKCFYELHKEKEMKSDKNELLRVKKKYSPKYILTAKMLEIYLFFLIFIIVSSLSKNIGMAVLFVVGLLLIMFTALILGKKSASKTYIVFGDKKIVYKRKFLFINTEREIAYEDVKDIVFTQGTSWIQRIFQKAFGLGNIYVYPKKGNILLNGIQLEVVADIDKVIEDIKMVVGDKIK